MCLQKRWIFWLRKNHLHETYFGFTNLLVGAHQDFASSEDFPCEFKMLCLLMCAERCWGEKNNVHICVPAARRRLCAYFAKYAQNRFLSTKKPAAKKVPPAGPLPQDKTETSPEMFAIFWTLLHYRLAGPKYQGEIFLCQVNVGLLPPIGPDEGVDLTSDITWGETMWKRLTLSKWTQK